MKTLNEIFLEFRDEEWAKHEPNSHLFREMINGRAHERAGKEYARQVAQDALNRAAEKLDNYVIGSQYMDMILSTEIILP